MMENAEYFMIHVDFRPPPDENTVNAENYFFANWPKDDLKCIS